MSALPAFTMVVAIFALVMQFIAAYIKWQQGHPGFMFIWLATAALIVLVFASPYLLRWRRKRAEIARQVAEKLTGEGMAEALDRSER